MMEQKLFDSERRVMQVLWEHGDLPAKEISRKLAETAGWNKNTTYTVIKKCVEKAFIDRREPGFVCHALLSEEQGATARGRRAGKQSLFRLALAAVCVLLAAGAINQAEIDKLRRLIDDYE